MLTREMYEFRLRDWHPLRFRIQSDLTTHTFCNSPRKDVSTLQPHNKNKSNYSGLGSFRFARRYSGNNYCSLFLGVLRCFNSPRSLLGVYVRGLWSQPERFPHSEISGSKLDYQLPEAYRR